MSSFRILKTAHVIYPRRGIHCTPICRLTDHARPSATAPSENRTTHALLTQALLRIGELAGKLEHNEKVVANLQNRQHKDTIEIWRVIKETSTQEEKKKSCGFWKKHRGDLEFRIMMALLFIGIMGPTLLEIWETRAPQQAQNTKDQTIARSQEDVELKVPKSVKGIEIQEPLPHKQPEETLGIEYNQDEVAEHLWTALRPLVEAQKMADSLSSDDAEDEKEGEKAKTMEEPGIEIKKKEGSRFGVRETMKWFFGF